MGIESFKRERPPTAAEQAEAIQEALVPESPEREGQPLEKGNEPGDRAAVIDRLGDELRGWRQEATDAELAPFGDERPEEYLERVTQSFIDDKYGAGATMIFEKGANIQNDSRYQAAMRKAIGLLEEMESRPREKFSSLKNEQTFAQVVSLIGSASNRGKELEGMTSYAHTNQERVFRGKANKADNTPYAHSLFRLGFESDEADAYLARRLAGKRIVLLGGGHSLDDLLHAPDIHPAEIVNVDPFITEEKIDRNDDTPYRSVPFRAEDPRLVEELRAEGVAEADEVWSSYSVPYYLDSAEDIAGLFGNVRGLLAENGSARITPLKIQSVEGGEDQFAAASAELLAEVRSLLDDEGYNAYVVGETLIVERLPLPPR